MQFEIHQTTFNCISHPMAAGAKIYSQMHFYVDIGPVSSFFFFFFNSFSQKKKKKAAKKGRSSKCINDKAVMEDQEENTGFKGALKNTVAVDNLIQRVGMFLLFFFLMIIMTHRPPIMFLVPGKRLSVVITLLHSDCIPSLQTKPPASCPFVRLIADQWQPSCKSPYI